MSSTPPSTASLLSSLREESVACRSRGDTLGAIAAMKKIKDLANLSSTPPTSQEEEEGGDDAMSAALHDDDAAAAEAVAAGDDDANDAGKGSITYSPEVAEKRNDADEEVVQVWHEYMSDDGNTYFHQVRK